MRRVLHILTRKDDAVARVIVARQQNAPQRCEIEIIDLTAGPPDYRESLEKVFTADSVACW